MRRPSCVFSLVMVRPCFFLRVPDMAPRTLCVCQCSTLLICSTVAPSGRRNIVSSCSSFDFALRAWGFGWTVLVAADGALAAVFFPLVIVAPWIASTGGIAGALAFAPSAHEPPVEKRIIPLLCSQPHSHSMAANFSDEMVQAMSSQRHIDKLVAPTTIAYGSLETPE